MLEERMGEFVMNSIVRAVPLAGKFLHRFGGQPAHRGTVPRGDKQPLHLLYTFDTYDPLFPIKISNARFLPLYYCFPYNTSDIGYKVVSDTEIEILHMRTRRAMPDFPYENYPANFPEVPVSLVPVTYEEHKTLIYYMALEDHFMERDYLNEADKRFIESIGYPFTQIGGVQRMWQGVPEVGCPNKKCENHNDEYSMGVFAVIWNQPVPDVYLWDVEPDFRDNTDVQLIFQICSECHAIYVCNRCT
jgi:hypothetical protein